jgi:hypothetical protein
MPDPDTAVLTVTGYAPTLGVTLRPATAVLTIERLAPTVTSPQDKLLFPREARLTVFGPAPNAFEFEETAILSRRITIKPTLQAEVKVNRA